MTPRTESLSIARAVLAVLGLWAIALGVIAAVNAPNTSVGAVTLVVAGGVVLVRARVGGQG